MSKRKILIPDPEATKALHDVIRKFCEEVEWRKPPVGVLAQLAEQPREA